MLYNKNMFKKTNDKPLMHKIGKRWVVVSLSTLAFLGLGAVKGATTHAASVQAKPQQAKVAPQSAKVNTTELNQNQTKQSASQNVAPAVPKVSTQQAAKPQMNVGATQNNSANSQVSQALNIPQLYHISQNLNNNDSANYTNLVNFMSAKNLNQFTNDNSNSTTPSNWSNVVQNLKNNVDQIQNNDNDTNDDKYLSNLDDVASGAQLYFNVKSDEASAGNQEAQHLSLNDLAHVNSIQSIGAGPLFEGLNKIVTTPNLVYDYDDALADVADLPNQDVKTRANILYGVNNDFQKLATDGNLPVFTTVGNQAKQIADGLMATIPAPKPASAKSASASNSAQSSAKSATSSQNSSAQPASAPSSAQSTQSSASQQSSANVVPNINPFSSATTPVMPSTVTSQPSSAQSEALPSASSTVSSATSEQNSSATSARNSSASSTKNSSASAKPKKQATKSNRARNAKRNTKRNSRKVVGINDLKNGQSTNVDGFNFKRIKISANKTVILRTNLLRHMTILGVGHEYAGDRTIKAGTKLHVLRAFVLNEKAGKFLRYEVKIDGVRYFIAGGNDYVADVKANQKPAKKNNRKPARKPAVKPNKKNNAKKPAKQNNRKNRKHGMRTVANANDIKASETAKLDGYKVTRANQSGWLRVQSHILLHNNVLGVGHEANVYSAYKGYREHFIAKFIVRGAKANYVRYEINLDGVNYFIAGGNAYVKLIRL